jgi:hypothetical protein
MRKKNIRVDINRIVSDCKFENKIALGGAGRGVVKFKIDA